MLRRFNVKNFTSFSFSEDGKTEEFSMIPGKVRNLKNHIYNDGQNKLLKFSAIYGANASGKSNIVKAISCMRNILLHNSTIGYIDKYSKIGEGNEKKPSYFEAEIVIDGKRYSYGFEVILSQSRFVAEWLVELINDDEKVIFERNIENNKFDIIQEWLDKAELKTRLEIYLEEASSNEPTLFLYTINQQKDKFYEMFPQVLILKRVYEWFENSLNVNGPEKPVYGYSFRTSIDKINKSIRMLNSFGTGVRKFEKKELPFEEVLSQLPPSIRRDFTKETNKIKILYEKDLELLEQNEELLHRGNISPENIKIIESNHKKIMAELENSIAIRTKKSFFIREQSVNGKNKNLDIKAYEIKLIHSDNNSFDFMEESDGTQRLWDILEVLLTDENKTFVIDELDRCLHPSLTYKFVKEFFKISENKNVQLIVTTHESRLLDFNLLRRDEIWFVDKRNTGESDIYSLEEYNERFDKKIDKAYLEGRYGGVPVFTTIFPVEGD